MNIPTNVIRMANKAVTTVKKYSPQIMMAIGAVTSVTAVVEAVKQTPKAIDILEEHKAQAAAEKEALAVGDEKYGDREYKINISKLYISTAGKLAKTYAMPVAMEIASLLCFFNAHKIMSARNKQLAAALATVTDAYNSYRNKMIEVLGEEKEEQIRLGLEEEKITETIVDEATGKKKKVTSTIYSVDEDNLHLGPWDILWGEGDYNYDQSEEINDMTIVNIANSWTRMIYEYKAKPEIPLSRIIADKFVPENEVYTKYPNFMVNGYTQANKDQAVVISSRFVKIYHTDPETGIRTYRNGRVLTFNGDGNIVR